MSGFRFENVRLAFLEENRQVRQGIRSALFAQGFRDIVDTQHLDAVREQVERNCVDVLVGDADIDGWCDMVHSIRHHQIGNNPFLIVISFSSDPVFDKVRRVMNCGTDDVIAKPAKPGQLVQRLGQFVRKRKPFVVTHDYIGPDRRKEPRPDDNPNQLFEVPNPLRSRVMGGQDIHAVQRLVDTAAMRINEQKMERYAVQISYLVERIVPALEARQIEEQLQADIERLAYVAEDLGRRLRGTNFAHISELALSLTGLVNRVREDLANPDSRDLQLLPKIAQATMRAFTPEKAAAEVASQISESVSGFARRAGE